YKDEMGRRKQKSTRCTHKPSAMVVLSDFSKFIADEHKVRPTPFTSFTKDFLKYAESNLSKVTANIYAHAFKQFIRICGDMDIRNISPKHWDDFKTYRLQEKICLRRKFITAQETAIAIDKQPAISPVSVNIELRHLKSSMNTATRWQLIPKNPWEKLPLISIPKVTPPFMMVEDAELLLSGITKQWLKDMVIFGLNTGCRRGEILSLRWSDIDTEKRIANITNRADFVTKGGEQKVIALNDAAVMVLNRRKAAACQEFIFTDELGRKIQPSRATHEFKKYVRLAGLPAKLHLHSCRHSFASILVGTGTSIFSVSKLLNHSSTRTSEIYSHAILSNLHTEVDKIRIGMS
ncbi:MAG TPA: site-specific integrase, partial [Nitrosomonas sp.]|nr:site-specific integrase [Nitrosomonas sp.]